MIKLLKKRGQYIQAQKWKKVHKIEESINDEIKDNYDVLTTPTMCVITFEEEEGKKISIGPNNKTREAKLLGQTLRFRKAPSPTDIIWENREKKDYLRKYLMAFSALLFLLLCSFVFVY